eukprot:TRINITY_DN5031_c0_g1_i1.p1 TRINITY_DN5031_c0_g1~~TRINITY_DN5031_c0_g1_i1.p1  ORF type:complete len:67 (+),score=37.75 TRINITY_DN5031_c0_g1_i1:217-417(+)
MVNEAEANAAADKEKSEQIEVKNQADSVCYQTKKQLEELGSKIDTTKKKKYRLRGRSSETAKAHRG